MCKYCEGEVDDRQNLLTDTCDGCDLTYEIYIGGNQMHSSFASVDINYCPMCGIKLDKGV